MLVRPSKERKIPQTILAVAGREQRECDHAICCCDHVAVIMQYVVDDKAIH